MHVKALHGDMSQGQRDGVMIAFKGGRERLLVATDVAARGLDITGVTHVVNYDVPNSPDVYVHRIGRTGRVGARGPRDHADHAEAAARPRGDRAPREDARSAQWSANGKGAAALEGRARGAAAIPTARRAGRGTRSRTARRRALLEADRRRSGRRTASSPPTSSSAVVDHTHLENDDVRNVRVLERFSLRRGARGRAREDVAEAVSGKQARGAKLLSWR